MTIYPSRQFLKDLKSLYKDSRYQTKVKKILYLLQQNPNHPSLRLHKLSGTNNYSISVDMSIRIIINIDSDNIYLLRIGPHQLVY